MLSNLKFLEEQLAGKGVSALPNDLAESGKSPEEIKRIFDEIPKAIIALNRFNALIESLAASTGASEIGATSYKEKTFENVQKGIESAIDYVDEKIQAIGAGDMAKAEFVNEGGGGIVLNAVNAENASKLNNKSENALNVSYAVKAGSMDRLVVRAKATGSQVWGSSNVVPVFNGAGTNIDLLNSNRSGIVVPSGYSYCHVTFFIASAVGVPSTSAFNIGVISTASHSDNVFMPSAYVFGGQELTIASTIPVTAGESLTARIVISPAPANNFVYSTSYCQFILFN